MQCGEQIQGQQGVFALLLRGGEVAGFGGKGIVSVYGACEARGQEALGAGTHDVATLFGIDIESFGVGSRHVGGMEGHQFAVVVGLDGLNGAVVQMLGSIGRNAVVVGRAHTGHPVVTRLRDVVGAGGIVRDFFAFAGDGTFDMAVEQPERRVEGADVLDFLGRFHGRGSQEMLAYVLDVDFLGLGGAYGKWNDPFGFEATGEAGTNEGGAFAIHAKGGGFVGFAQNGCATFAAMALFQGGFGG